MPNPSARPLAPKHAEAGITLTLPGAPRTKKNSGKIWKVGKRTVIRPSEPWIRWRDDVFRHSVKGNWPKYNIATPVNCCAHFYRDARRGDAVGYYQGLADVLEAIGVVEDDKWIETWDGSRLFVDRDNPRVQLVLSPTAHG